MGEAIRPLRPATVKADERHYILDMNPEAFELPSCQGIVARLFEPID